MILIIGDIHGNFTYLNSIMEIYTDVLEMVLSVGELGYWPSVDKEPVEELILHRDIPIYFCDGNHEDFVFLNSLGQNGEVGRNIFHKKRGSVVILPDGRTVLFMGGAFSIDWPYRRVGIDWFPQDEIIRESDLINLPDIPVDIVISHTSPTFFEAISDHGTIAVNEGSYYDPSRTALDYVYEKYHPDMWYFGHFHNWAEGNYEKCHWIQLNAVPKTNWYRILN